MILQTENPKMQTENDNSYSMTSGKCPAIKNTQRPLAFLYTDVRKKERKQNKLRKKSHSPLYLE